MMNYDGIIKKLKDNYMGAYVVKNPEELFAKLNELLKEVTTVSVGGSMSLFETGVIDYLQNGNFEFLNRYEKGLTNDQIQNIYRQTFFVDAYITSTNALTEEGELYNVDGNGNRVAAMIYGPKSVIVIAGKNKIVKDIEEAKQRVRKVAAPKNAKRLNRSTPCVKLGYCVDCKSPDRICSDYVIFRRQAIKNRIKVIIFDGNLGY